MQKERTTLKVAALANNTGQLGWLPSNPRQWTQTDIDRTAKSLTNDPDFLEDRPLLALQDGKGFVVFAGNLRLTAARKLKLKEVPGIIYTPESDEDRETIKRRSILDNGSFGAWDYDALANEWDDLALADWGVPAWSPQEEFDPSALFEQAGDPTAKGEKITIEVPDEQTEHIEDIRAALQVTLEGWKGCKVK